jgi:hypothetical protein
MSTKPEEVVEYSVEDAMEQAAETNTLRVIGWFSIGMAVAALGIYLGSELRSRYKFKRRTPYDFYANAGERQASEFGMGI